MKKISVPIILPIIAIILLTTIVVILVLCLRPTIQDYQYFKRTKVEIKAWIDLNGTHGMEIIPEISINQNYFNKVTGDMQPLWLDNRYRYNLTAKDKINSYCFLFWQRESDGLIIPDKSLILEPGFRDEKWWINYGKCP